LDAGLQLCALILRVMFVNKFQLMIIVCSGVSGISDAIHVRQKHVSFS